MRKGFSLVELSIVLVILGLLTGGILAGQSLIRASELHAVASEYQRYVAASNTFRDKYFAVAGDFRDATRFWSRLNANPDCVTNSTTGTGSPGACDGDGDGRIWRAGAGGESAEFAQFWRQLALAGLIEGSYSGLAGTGGVWHAQRGINSPASKLGNGTWSSINLATVSGDGTLFDGAYDNCAMLGVQNTASAASAVILKPEELWNIDTKMDDGMPANGRITPRNRIDCAIAANGAALTSTAGDAAKLDSVYNLSNTAVTCALLFRRL